METITRGITYTDLMHRGRPRIIATAILQSPGGVALVDPGPTSCLETLRASLADAGIGVGDLRALLLTHIHLDHAGAAGSLLAENPEIEVYVHERGAPHMIDPAKLLGSARRLYGDAMDDLWGAFLPVPETAVRILKGGERIAVADREARGGVYAGPCVAPRQLFRSVEWGRVRRRRRGRPYRDRAVRHAADAATRHRH